MGHYLWAVILCDPYIQYDNKLLIKAQTRVSRCYIYIIVLLFAIMN